MEKWMLLAVEAVTAAGEAIALEVAAGKVRVGETTEGADTAGHYSG